MKRNILIAVAWPYASADIHVGNITGSYLPADIYARFHRLQGNNVLMVSGSDSHGTPITVRADEDGITPEEVYQQFHNKFLDLFQKLGLSYDLFTSTHTENHFRVAQTMFSALKEKGYMYAETQQQWYSTSQERFLPDRYVEGTCYICDYENARGDQCDQCGNLLEANELINPRSKMDGSTPELRDTEHFYLDLGTLQSEIVDFLKEREDYWRPNVIRQSLGQILADDLHGRAMTRDLKWGIPVPVDGWEDKRLYVWFEAVIGYLSAAIEWAALTGDKERWKEWWYNTDSRTYYFIGKDNIPFHAVIWPAELAGVGTTFGALFDEDDSKALVLPYDVPANEFLNMEGKKISGSRNWVVDGLDFLSRYDPDSLRYYLTANIGTDRYEFDTDGSTTGGNIAVDLNGTGTPDVTATNAATQFTAAVTTHDTVGVGASRSDAVVTLTADTPGSAGNSIATTETCTNAAFGAATLTGGTDEDATATNAATQFTAAVTTHDTVGVGASRSDAVVTLTADVAGSAGNSIATTETCTNAAFGAATLTGGEITSAWASDDITTAADLWEDNGSMIAVAMVIVVVGVVLLILRGAF